MLILNLKKLFMAYDADKELARRIRDGLISENQVNTELTKLRNGGTVRPVAVPNLRNTANGVHVMCADGRSKLVTNIGNLAAINGQGNTSNINPSTGMTVIGANDNKVTYIQHKA